MMIRSLALLISCSSAAACANVTAVRTGDAIPLPSRLPATPCEEDRALEVAPTKVFAQGYDDGGMRGPLYVTIVREEAAEGLGIYRVDSKELIQLPEILPELQNRDLERRHMARIQPIHDKLDRKSTWAWVTVLGATGLLAAGTPLVVIGVSEDNRALGITGAVLLSSAMFVPIVGLIGALNNMPTGQETVYRDVRDRIFLDGEDDLVQVVKSVDEFNQRARATCR